MNSKEIKKNKLKESTNNHSSEITIHIKSQKRSEKIGRRTTQVEKLKLKASIKKARELTFAKYAITST